MRAARAMGWWLTLPLLWGCGPGFGGAGGRPAGTRHISITLPDALVSTLGSQVTAVQLASLAIVAPDQVSVHVTPAIDPRSSAVLGGYFPTDSALVCVVQTVAASGGSGPGRLLARVRFDAGFGGQATLVPRAGADHDLGVPELQLGNSAMATALDLNASHNPLAAIDTDGDGKADVADDDDDNDGTLDSSDTDMAGDGVEDRLQLLEALPDDNGDGTPDIYG